MGMQFIKAGLQTSIQDGGRTGYMDEGISPGGSMDPLAMQMANWLVSKPLNSAVIEITLVGPVIKFDTAVSIAVCGAHFELSVNQQPVPGNSLINLSKGDVLSFGKLKCGARAYLAFSAELTIKKVMQSHATHITAGFGGYHGRQLSANDYLDFYSLSTPDKRSLPEFATPTFSGSYLLRCLPSVESSLFNAQLTAQFYQQSYGVLANSNRMGIRLVSNSQQLSTDIQITSSGLIQGSIQIPPSGQPIISSVDGQSIGGYPRIANIISADLSLLGQLKAKDKLRFTLIKKQQALEILNRKKALLSFLSD